MKKLLSLILLLAVSFASFTAHAGGKLIAQPTYYEHLNKTRGNLGLAVYQSFGSLVALNSWTGYGLEAVSKSEDQWWLTSKNSLDFNFGKVTMAPGVQLTYTEDDKNLRERYFVKLSYQLW